MSARSVSQFSIYNFFSVLLPGVIFLIGIYPLIPIVVGPLPLGALIPILAIGFVTGQFIHIISVWSENKLGILSHRDLLSQQFCSATVLSEDTIDEFHLICRFTFEDIGLSDNKTDDSKDDELMDTLYVRVRSYVDFESRGRSQVFQAIYAFCRSICFTMVLLMIAYTTYAVIQFLKGASSSTSIPQLYTAKISMLGLTPAIVLNITLFTVVTVFYVFWGAKREYRRYFVQYLITEFLLLQNEE